MQLRKTTLKHSICLVLFVAFSLAASAQTSSNKGKPTQTDDTIIETYKVIVMTVTVESEAGIDVKDLRHGDFGIYENGVQQIQVSWRRVQSRINGIPRTRYQLAYIPINHRCDGRFRIVRVK